MQQMADICCEDYCPGSNKESTALSSSQFPSENCTEPVKRLSATSDIQTTNFQTLLS